jgi:nicotinic acid mononucleotide adenylyltransferase
VEKEDLDRQGDKNICIMYKMASFVAAAAPLTPADKKDNVVFSYQGSFGPPTYGHYKSMEAFAQQLSKEYSGEIKMYFMMSPGGSKNHLFPTQEMRKRVLQMFCDMLMSKKDTNERIQNKNITFEVGNEEIEIANSLPAKPNKEIGDQSIGTIDTINMLSDKFNKDEYNICLGMGLDNAYQLPYWAKINDYASKVYKIYVVPRDPTADELEKTRRFIVENTAEPTAETTAKTTVEMRFDITVPWKNDTFLNCFLPPGSAVTKDTVNKDVLIAALNSVNNDGKEPYKFYQTLPPVVVLTNEETTSAAAATKLSIPATSSSMMRYFIGQYLQDIDKNINLEKIQKLMFGPGVLIENPTGGPTGGPTVKDKTDIVMDTINDYRKVFNGKFPDNANVKEPKEKTYEDQYTSIEGFSGGNRKTKRRRTNKKRRSQRKKRRSQRK